MIKANFYSANIIKWIVPVSDAGLVWCHHIKTNIQISPCKRNFSRLNRIVPDKTLSNGILMLWNSMAFCQIIQTWTKSKCVFMKQLSMALLWSKLTCLSVIVQLSKGSCDAHIAKINLALQQCLVSSEVH